MPRMNTQCKHQVEGPILTIQRERDRPFNEATPNSLLFRYVASQKCSFNLNDNFGIWWERLLGLPRRSVAQAPLCSPVNRKGYLLVLEVNNEPVQLVRWRLHQSHFPTDKEINTLEFLPVLCLNRAHHVLIANSGNKPSTGPLVQHTTHMRTQNSLTICNLNSLTIEVNINAENHLVTQYVTMI